MQQTSSQLLRRDLDQTAAYWLKTVQRRIAGRQLRGVELYVAKDAFDRLKQAAQRVEEWNRMEGQTCPISLPDFNLPEFRQPEALYAENFPKPEVLAGIAATLVAKPEAPLSTEGAVLYACELFTAAKRYIESLPHKPTEELEADFQVGVCSFVSVDEIHESNRSAKCLPLLPSLRLRRKGVKEITASQTEEAILEAMVAFTKGRVPVISEQEFQVEEEQDRRLFPQREPQTWEQWQGQWQKAVADVRQNKRVCVHDLCTLRWQRFKRQSDSQSATAISREQKGRTQVKSATRCDNHP